MPPPYPPPPTAMCQLVLHLRAPTTSWTTLSELYTLHKLEYHRTVPGGPYTRPMTERDFQARGKELVTLVELDEPVAALLPKATGISWPFASWVKYILSRPGLLRPLHRSFSFDVHCRRGCVPRGQG